MSKARHYTRPTLAINRCPRHRNFWAITLDVAGGGRRVTPSKCCGQWDVVHEWPLTATEWRQLAEEAGAMADMAERRDATHGDAA